MMKRAVIVGASSGMGREVALQLLADGWQLGIAARRTQALLQLQAAHPHQVEVETLDVVQDDAPARLLSLVKKLGGVDLYLHASGIGKQNLDLSPVVELKTVETNALGFTRMITAIYNYMAAHDGGHIAVITSIAGTKGLGIAPGYSATKTFQNSYIQALEQQAHMRHLDILFTDIRPGFVNTDLLNDSHSYPMLMDVKPTASLIVKAIYRKKHIAVIDWRYRCLTAAWRRIPRILWRQLKIKTKG